MKLRAALTGVMALLIAAQVVRNAAVRSLSDAAPAAAARVWPAHPHVKLSLGMIEIAAAAREGRPVPAAVFDSIYGASIKAPLALEPYLVRGVQAQLSGNGALAEQAFLQARWRDGRSRPARYFLADHYLRRRDAANGLREIAVLARLVPDGMSKLAPYVARYASDRANQDQLRALFRTEPALEDSALSVLAGDSGSADLVLSLSNPRRRNANSAWLPHLLGSLIADGQYSKAREIWARLSGVDRASPELIYDPQFSRESEPPPFNWSLTSSAVGLAERQRGGGLHVIYYGQQEGVLASQLLILPAGNYRLATRASGAEQAESMKWNLVCAATNVPIASVPLDQAIRSGWTFTVSPACPAQRLELEGVLLDAPRQADVTIHSVTVSRKSPNG